jgi:hypothetical protein
MLLLFLSTSPSSLAACAELGDGASGGRQHWQARRLLVSPPSTHKAEQRMRVGAEKKPFKINVGASLGRRRIPSSTWSPIHN